MPLFGLKCPSEAAKKCLCIKGVDKYLSPDGNPTVRTLPSRALVSIFVFCLFPSAFCSTPGMCLTAILIVWGNRLESHFIPVWAQLALYWPIYSSVQITGIFLADSVALCSPTAGISRLAAFVLSCCVVSHARWRYVAWCSFLVKASKPSNSCIVRSGKCSDLFSFFQNTTAAACYQWGNRSFLLYSSCWTRYHWMCVNKRCSFLLLSLLNYPKTPVGAFWCTLKKYFEAFLASHTFHVFSTEQYFCTDCQSVSKFLCHSRSPSAWKHQIIPCLPNICKPQFSLGSLLTVSMFSLLHTQHHSMPFLVFSSDLLLPILLSSLYASMFACLARLAQLCTKVHLVFQDVSDKSSRRKHCGEDK